MPRLVALAIVCAAASACAGEPSALAAVSQVRRDVELTVVQRSAYAVGRPVPLLVRLRNTRREAVTLRGTAPLRTCRIELRTQPAFEEVPPTRRARAADGEGPGVGETRVAAGESITAVIDLALQRDLTVAGSYALALAWSPDPDAAEPLTFHLDLQDIELREQDAAAPDLAAALADGGPFAVDAATRARLLALAEDAVRGQHSAFYEGTPVLRLLGDGRAEVAFPRRRSGGGSGSGSAYDHVVVLDRTARRVIEVRIGE